MDPASTSNIVLRLRGLPHKPSDRTAIRSVLSLFRLRQLIPGAVEKARGEKGAKALTYDAVEKASSEAGSHLKQLDYGSISP